MKAILNMRINKNSMVEHYFVVGVALVLFLANQSGAINELVAICYLVVGLVCLYRVRNSWKLLIIYGWMLYSNYSIAMAFFLDPLSNFFTTYATTVIGATGNNIILFFSICTYLILPSHSLYTEEFILVDENRRNDAFYLCLMGALVLIFVWGFAAPSEVNGRGEGAPAYEYSIILFILCFYYCGKSKLYIALTAFLMLLYTLQEFIYGGRVTGIQQVICLFLCLFCDKISIKKTLPFLFVMYLLLTLIGQFRGALSLSFDIIKSAVESISDSMFVLDTAYSACHTSMTYIDVAQQLSWSERLCLFWQWCKSIVLGSSVPDFNLSSYTRQFHMHYGGGILPFYFYFYLGLPGVVLITVHLFFLFKIIRNTSSKSSGYLKCLSIYLTTGAVRWYLYSPSGLFRGLLFMTLAYGGLQLADKILHPNHRFC